MEKILSILIPTYNMEKYLDSCLSSLLINTNILNFLEVIIINDGSTDNSLNIAKKYQEKYPSIFIIIDKANGNYGSCINQGLKIAKGNYIKILDSDDSFITKSLQDFMYILKSNIEKSINIDCYITDYQTINDQEKILSINKTPIESNILLQFSQVYTQVLNIPMHALTYNRNLFNNLDYKQSERISYTDQEWIFKPFAYVKSLYYYPVILYSYLIGRTGQTVSPEVHSKKLWMEIIVLEKLIADYNSIYSNVEEINKQFLITKLIDRCNLIYRYFLIEYRNNSDLTLLINLNSYIKTNAPFILPYIFKSKSSIFSYIKHWFKKETTNCIYFKLFYFCITTKNKIKKLFK